MDMHLSLHLSPGSNGGTVGMRAGCVVEAIRTRGTLNPSSIQNIPSWSRFSPLYIVFLHPSYSISILYTNYPPAGPTRQIFYLPLPPILYLPTSSASAPPSLPRRLPLLLLTPSDGDRLQSLLRLQDSDCTRSEPSILPVNGPDLSLQ